MNLALKRVFATGLGAVTPLGNGIPQYWDALINGVSGADGIKQFDVTKFKTKFACEVKNFNPEDFFERKEARKLDRFSQFALVAADEAVRHSNLTQEGIDHDRVGIIWGSG